MMSALFFVVFVDKHKHFRGYRGGLQDSKESNPLTIKPVQCAFAIANCSPYSIRLTRRSHYMNLLNVGSGLFCLLLKLSFGFNMLCWITSVMLMCSKTNFLCSFSLAALFSTVPIPF